MTKKTFLIKKNKDGTITVKVGRAVEHISKEGKDKAELFDAVKYALISKGISVHDLTIATYLGEGG